MQGIVNDTLKSNFSSAKLFSIGRSLITLDDFEIDEGHFNSFPTYSGSTVGIASNSTLVRDNSTAYAGEGSLKAEFVDDASSEANWFIRLLSGGGNPLNNILFANSGTITFWLKTSNEQSGAKVQIWIDDSDGLEISQSLPIVKDGEWHKYSFDLSDFNGFTYNGNGTLDAAQLTLDAIVLSQSNPTDNRELFIDEVIYDYFGTGTGVILIGKIQTPLNNSNEEILDYMIYPNPSKGEFRVDCLNDDNSVFELNIYTLTGEMVLQQHNITSGQSISATGLLPGIYFVHLINTKQRKVIKLVVASH